MYKSTLFYMGLWLSALKNLLVSILFEAKYEKTDFSSVNIILLSHG